MLDSPSDTLGYAHCIGQRRLWQQEEKLLTAKASRDIVVTQVAAQNVGHHFEDIIAHIVPVRIIDLLEEIDVKHEHGKTSIITRTDRDKFVQLALHVVTVQKAGESVTGGLLIELVMVSDIEVVLRLKLQYCLADL